MVVFIMNEERKRILKMVEEGSLTAEEALILLERLEKDNKSDKQAAVSTRVQSDGGRKEEAQTKQTTSTSSKLMDILDSVFRKIRDMDLDLNFGPAVEISHIFQHSDVSLNHVEIDVANGSVKILPWDEKDVRIECETKIYKTETQEAARKAFLQDVVFSIDAGKLQFSVQKKQMKVNAVIYIPRVEYEFVTIRMFNGSITGERLQVKDLKAKTANGKISMTQVVANDLEVETANGPIHVIGDAKEIEAETINGKIDVIGRYEKTDLRSFNGSIVLELQNENCQTAHIKTTTGNINIYLPNETSVRGELKSNFGKLTCYLQDIDIIQEKNDAVQKILHFKKNKEKDLPFHLFAETKAGSIVIKPSRGE
jgi:DUF4097 and DUF4098 domain-containing protein YvlB